MAWALRIRGLQSQLSQVLWPFLLAFLITFLRWLLLTLLRFALGLIDTVMMTMSWQPPCKEGVCLILFFSTEWAAGPDGAHICHGTPQCTFGKPRTHLVDPGPQLLTTLLSILSLKAYETKKQLLICPYLLRSTHLQEVTLEEVRFEILMWFL